MLRIRLPLSSEPPTARPSTPVPMRTPSRPHPRSPWLRVCRRTITRPPWTATYIAVSRGHPPTRMAKHDGCPCLLRCWWVSRAYSRGLLWTPTETRLGGSPVALTWWMSRRVGIWRNPMEIACPGHRSNRTLAMMDVHVCWWSGLSSICY